MAHDLTKRNSISMPKPSSIGDSSTPGSDYRYTLNTYPTIDLMNGKGPSRAPGTSTSLPILTEEDRKTGRIG